MGVCKFLPVFCPFFCDSARFLWFWSFRTVFAMLKSKILTIKWMIKRHEGWSERQKIRAPVFFSKSVNFARFSPVFLLKKCPFFTRLFWEKAPYEELATLIFLLCLICLLCDDFVWWTILLKIKIKFYDALMRKKWFEIFTDAK